MGLKCDRGAGLGVVDGDVGDGDGDGDVVRDCWV